MIFGLETFCASEKLINFSLYVSCILSLGITLFHANRLYSSATLESGVGLFLFGEVQNNSTVKIAIAKVGLSSDSFLCIHVMPIKNS